MIGGIMAISKRKQVPRWDSVKQTAMKQTEFSFDALAEIQASRKMVDLEKQKYVAWRSCLKCDQKMRQKAPGLCEKCKRHEDYKDGGEDDNSVSS